MDNKMNDKIDTLRTHLRQFDESGRKPAALKSAGALIEEVLSGKPLSEEAKSTIVDSTQSTIASIHKSTVEYSAGMTVKNAEAIASIGIAHESKASEAILAIERMNESGLKAQLQESKNSKKGAFTAALLGIGAFGGALGLIQKIRK